MNIAILGGSGFVGHHLSAALAVNSHQIRILTRNPFNQDRTVLPPGSHYYFYDPYQQDSLNQSLQGMDVVINLVGILNESGRNGKGFEKAHVQLTKNLIQACEEANIDRVLQMSALNAGQGNSHYLKTKGKAEALLNDSNMKLTFFCPSVIFGTGDSFFNRFALLLTYLPLPMPLPGFHARMAPVWVEDVVAAMLVSLKRRDSYGKRYELCGPEIYSLGELIQFTAQQMGIKRWIIPLPDIFARIQGLIFDFLPIKVFTTDNYRSLQTDSICSENGFKALGIKASSIHTVVGKYIGQKTHAAKLQTFRKTRLNEPEQ